MSDVAARQPFRLVLPVPGIPSGLLAVRTFGQTWALGDDFVRVPRHGNERPVMMLVMPHQAQEGTCLLAISCGHTPQAFNTSRIASVPMSFKLSQVYIAQVCGKVLSYSTTSPCPMLILLPSSSPCWVHATPEFHESSLISGHLQLRGSRPSLL